MTKHQTRINCSGHTCAPQNHLLWDLGIKAQSMEGQESVQAKLEVVLYSMESFKVISFQKLSEISKKCPKFQVYCTSSRCTDQSRQDILHYLNVRYQKALASCHVEEFNQSKQVAQGFAKNISSRETVHRCVVH